MPPGSHNQLIITLQNRFETNISRHGEIDWSDVLKRLEKAPSVKIMALSEMERTGGEPDVIGRDPDTGEIVFCDCSEQSPSGRRSLCYDQRALEGRKEHKPVGSAIEMAHELGIELLTEEEYRQLQALGEYDTKTSSWIVTPPAIRKLSGALFADRRFDAVFVYHNGAESYYASRGFREKVKV